MNDIFFKGISGWFVSIFFILIVLIVGGLLSLELLWRILAKRNKKKMLKKWDDKYGVKQ